MLSRSSARTAPRRRGALESLFAARRLAAPWALCPSTTEADVVREWLTWASVGMEGVIFTYRAATLKRSPPAARRNRWP